MNELKVSLENIIPLTEARDHFSQIVTEVQKDKLYVLTKGGKPAVAIIDVKYLEHLTGGEVSRQNIVQEIKKAPEKVGLPQMVEHQVTPPKAESPISPSSTPPHPITPPPNKPWTPPAPKPPVSPPSSVSSMSPQNAPKPPTPTPSSSTPPTPPPPPTSFASTAPPNTDAKIDVQFSPDMENKSSEKDKPLLSQDDKPSPAQYAGKEEEVDDMSID